ncbi:aminotransferase class I/II-fold pyridoxal phosphate-dependent enzyme [Clostridium sporogenes]|uniref:aminotransferase class I/II-fold pyridoxal phosphate-dependent enzyme n=1 Tax=Clostridium sporogenes TaxID=1509 RepID=UPI00313B8C8B
MSLSKRGMANVKDMSPLMHADFSTRDKRYNPTTRKDGYINLGTAETHLIDDEIINLLYKLQNTIKLESKHLHYDFFHGSENFRTAIANHWEKVIFGDEKNRKIMPDNIVVGSGCSLALEMLATMLGDPGDVFLVPAPYYSGFEDDFSERAKIELVPVHCGENMDKDVFEKVYNEQVSKGKKVVGVLYSSPNNPTGTVYSEAALRNVIDFSMKHNLDIVSDEIYAQTIHDPSAKWISTLKLVPDSYIEHVHVTSSFAKDFALSGFRTGFAISFNKDLIKGMQNLAYYSGVSTHTQALLTELLMSKDLPKLMEDNRKQLYISYKRIEEALNKLDIKTKKAQGGIFIFAHFGKYLEENTFEGENKLWEKMFGDLRLNISPGKIFAADEPGWFRICYALEPSIIEEVIRRLSTLK